MQHHANIVHQAHQGQAVDEAVKSVDKLVRLLARVLRLDLSAEAGGAVVRPIRTVLVIAPVDVYIVWIGDLESENASPDVHSLLPTPLLRVAPVTYVTVEQVCRLRRWQPLLLPNMHHILEVSMRVADNDQLAIAGCCQTQHSRFLQYQRPRCLYHCQKYAARQRVFPIRGQMSKECLGFLPGDLAPGKAREARPPVLGDLSLWASFNTGD
mmetsp:Transcript_118666/g.378286  ORF Transcript_118666/g.378286 Transcript_118666/m.378286 type:complete len:211 (-) Transcript_118666:760-1392(-)